jgi:rod shape-determining protein MreC
MPLSTETTIAQRYSYSAYRLVFTLIFSFGIMYLDFNGKYLNTLRSYLSAAVYPVHILVNAPKNLFSSISGNINKQGKLDLKNQEINKENIILKSKIQQVYKLESENKRLRALLDSKPEYQNELTFAEIVSINNDVNKHSIIINKGSRENVYSGDVVSDSKGIIGQVIRDHIIGSEVLLITDPEHAIPIEIARNGLRSIALGVGNYEHIVLNYLPVSTDIKKGDVLITSGLGGKYPEGYPVATVKSISNLTGELFLKIEAKPFAELKNINEVWVIRQLIVQPFSIE